MTQPGRRKRAVIRVSVLVATILAAAACASPTPTIRAPSLPSPSRITHVPAPSDPWTALRREMNGLPSADPGDCPTLEGRVLSVKFAPGVGRGPVYAITPSRAQFAVDPTIRNGDGLFPLKVLWVAEPGFAQAVLVRGKATANDERIMFSGPFGDELRLDWAKTRAPTGEWLESPSYTLVPGSGCYFWQLDYSDGSDVIPFAVSILSP
jgi:hypothetical protein